MGHDVRGAVLRRIEILVCVDVGFRVQTVLFTEMCHKLCCGILAELAVADALDSDGVKVAADRGTVAALALSAA